MKKEAKAGDNYGAKEHDCCSEDVKLQALTLQGGEETGADLKTDRVDENEQPKIANKFEDALVDMHPKLSEENPSEQYTCCTQPDTSNAQAAESKPESGHDANSKDGLSDNSGR